MIDEWKSLRRYIHADATSRQQQASFRAFLTDPLFRFTVILRLLEYSINSNRSILLRLPIKLWHRSLSFRLGFSVGPNIFGPGLAIVHHGLLIVDPATRVGKNCRIHAGVNIGGTGLHVDPALTTEHSARIGDNVYIGPGAKIVGPVQIANGCVIGANAVITKSFEEPDCVIAGVPARIIRSRRGGDYVIEGA